MPMNQHGYDEVRRNEQCLEDQSKDNEKRQEGEERRYGDKEARQRQKETIKEKMVAGI